MNENENQGVEAVPAVETQSETPSEQATQQATSHADEQDRNWREARTVMKEQQFKIKELESQITKLVPTRKEEEPDDFGSLADDDIVTKKHLTNASNKTYERAKKDAYREFHNNTAEERLESKFPDFKRVCSTDNIEKLKQRYPDLAMSIAKNDDVYSQGKAVYDLITSLGINNSEIAKNKERIQENSNKPNLSAPSKSGPLDMAHMFEGGGTPSLTKNLQKSLWQEMQESIKRGP